jgi:ribonuclease-3
MTSPDTGMELLEKNLGYTFRNRALLREALTHGSYLQDEPEAGPNNQRLEFFGDSVLNYVITEAIFHEFPDEREGVLSSRRSVMLRGSHLAALAQKLGLDAHVRLGKSDEGLGGRKRASILEDVFEAVVGAVYLDSDIATAKQLILQWYGPLAGQILDLEAADNPKGRLQERVQPMHGNTALRYEVVATTGPRHALAYEVTVYLLNEKLGTGHGSSKKIAEEAAARAALEILASREQDGTK